MMLSIPRYFIRKDKPGEGAVLQSYILPWHYTLVRQAPGVFLNFSKHFDYDEPKYCEAESKSPHFQRRI